MTKNGDFPADICVRFVPKGKRASVENPRKPLFYYCFQEAPGGWSCGRRSSHLENCLETLTA